MSLTNEPTATCILKAGFPFWNAIRDRAQMERAHGFRCEVEEGKGWLSRTFIIRGSPDAIRRIKAAVESANAG